jgi:hypothetical protein
MSDTHVVTNQVPPLVDHNPASSPVLIEALIREGGQWGLDEVTEVGALSGSAQAQRWGWPTATSRSCTRTTATGIASTRSNMTPPITS